MFLGVVGVWIKFSTEWSTTHPLWKINHNFENLVVFRNEHFRLYLLKETPCILFLFLILQQILDTYLYLFLRYLTLFSKNLTFALRKTVIIFAYLITFFSWFLCFVLGVYIADVLTLPPPFLGVIGVVTPNHLHSYKRDSVMNILRYFSLLETHFVVSYQLFGVKVWRRLFESAPFSTIIPNFQNYGWWTTL